ncbi:MAG: prepilin-type N-terminal cleavage/methylation domain-containing protein [Pyrinomonadaceae bacterium]
MGMSGLLNSSSGCSYCLLFRRPIASSGFSLIELVITVTILAILTLAWPHSLG